VKRLAKIVSTIGPASSGEDVLSRLLQEGVDVVRLNLSHGNHETHRRILRRVRQTAQLQGRFVPVIVDLMGPRFRLGEIPDGPRMLVEGEEVSLGKASTNPDLPVEDSSFLTHLKRGERVLVDNGLVELSILRKGRRKVAAKVLHGGPVSTRKGINLPDTDLPFTISEKDRADIAFALTEGADYLAVSFVGSPEDLEAVRDVLRSLGGMLPLISKLERAKAMARLEEIVQATDAVMVARGDLGVEIPLHQVPVYQKRIINVGRRYGKPVIVATQMLESMMLQPRPTRAEASDCANAVFDGADALMLSGETAAGNFPVEAVQTMARVILEAEAFQAEQDTSTSSDDLIDQAPGFLLPNATEKAHLNLKRDRHLEIPDVVSSSAVLAANRLGARQIVAFSQGGFTARMIARYRPKTPILVFTRNREVAQRVQLLWGVRPLLMEHDVGHHDEVVSVVDRLLVENDLAKRGDVIVILMGDPITERPLTNLMRVHRVRTPGKK
jgi:pyruvate kinase